MKKSSIVLLFFMIGFVLPSQAQIPIIGTLLSKVIKAIDLKVQRMQNETLWLQNAQQVAEHKLSKIKIAEITSWQQKQENLYEDYFKELKLAKASITGMSQVKRIISLQAQVITEYNRFAKDATIKPEYDGLLSSSVEILQTLQVVIGGNVSMKDGDRIIMITTLRDAMNQCLKNIRTLNDQQLRLAAAHERLKADIQFVKRLNGIQ